MIVYCLFSIENNYDQPRDNLEAYWLNSPTILQLAKWFKVDLSNASDDDIIFLAHLTQGKEERKFNTDYRIEPRQSEDVE